MKKILEDLFYGEIKCHEGFRRTDEFRKANTMAVESLEALEAALDEEKRVILRQLDDAHSYMNAATALECYIDGFSTAAKLFSALLVEE